ncbi:MAG: hypothetical protein M3Z26_00340 [Bacteroidota bacterium]|nr:hypothetical protein [Bacteroidota bacterium]
MACFCFPVEVCWCGGLWRFRGWDGKRKYSLRRAFRPAIKQNINEGFCVAGFVFMILFFVRRNIKRALDFLPLAAFRFCVKPAAPSRDAGPP